MTDQERPVEERNELLDDLLTAANNVAVEEQDSSKQQPAVDEQPEPAAQPAAAPTAEATQAEDAPAATEQSAETPVAQASDTAESTTSEAPVEQSAEANQVGPAEPNAETAAAEASEALPAAAEQAAETAAAEVSNAAAAQTVVDPYAAAVGEAAPATAEAAVSPAAAGATTPGVGETEGASYTPVAEQESGKPRRVKDLEPGMELEGRVTSIALYGIFVDIGVGRDGLVHISEMSDTRIDSPSDIVQIGDTVKVRVKSVEPDGRRISLTMRSKERSSEPRSRGRKKPELNREALASLRVGDNVEGTVTGIAPFGVFVDIGVGKDGLVHVSELAEGRIEKAEDAVQIGQTYTFKILEVDADGTRISLSLRRAARGQRMQQLEKGQILEGTVSGLAPFGAFVDIGVGRDGLVHISELTEGRIDKVEDAVKVGDKVTARVLEIDPGSKRISLTLRLDDRPRETPPARPEFSSEPRGEPREDRGRRDERGRRDDRGSRGPRRERNDEPRPPEVYTSTDEPEDAFTGDATIEDLLSKFGSASKRDRKRRPDEEEDEGTGEDRTTRRQRDAIRRTLQQMNDDE
jgi:small subunit ribosomal protein S1